MISREKIEEIIFEKIVIAALIAIAGLMFISLFQTAQEKSEFIAKYTALNVELRKDAFEAFSSGVNDVFFILRKSASAPETKTYLESDDVSAVIASVELKIDALIFLSTDNSNFHAASQDCKKYS